MTEDLPPWEHITPHEAARLLGIKKGTVYKLRERGELRGHRVGRKIVIYRESVLELIRKNSFGLPPDGDGPPSPPGNLEPSRPKKRKKKGR